MRKMISSSELRAIIALVAIVPALRSGGANMPSETPLARPQFEAILNDLDSPFTKTEKRDRAAAKLRDFGINALPLLMEEVRKAGRIEETNRMASTDLKMKLQAAFQVLGPQAKPLLPELVAEFNAGRSLGIAPYALAQIGGGEAGAVLVQGLTNSNPQICACAAAAVEYFKNDSNTAKAAVRPLLLLLNNSSGPLRSLAANTLGILETDAATVVPALLRTAKSDPDSVVRATAVKSIARFGHDAVGAKPELSQIADTDEDADVRKMAARALEAVQAKPDQP